VAAENKRWPTIQEVHYEMYAKWVGEHGSHQHGMYFVNTQMLTHLNLEDTRDNRKWIANKFRVANPNYDVGSRDRKLRYLSITEVIERTAAEEITIEETQEVNNDKFILNNIINILNGETVESNFLETVAPDKIIELLLKSINTKGRRSEFNAKLHGLLTERKQTMPTGYQDDGPIILPEDLSKMDETEQPRSSETDT
jgi:hypothetical protein